MKEGEVSQKYTLENPLIIWFFGSKPIGYKCLDYLLQHNNIKVSYVIARAKDYEGWWNKGKKDKIRVRDLAEDKNIPVFTHKEFLEFFNTQELERPHLVISVEHGDRIPKAILEYAIIGGMNLHLAPLPMYRGCNTFSHAIINGDEEYWVTMHWMSPEFDAGEIIATGTHVKIDNKTAKQLYDEVMPTAFELFKEVIDRVLRGEQLEKIPQEEMGEPHYYYRKELRKIKKIKAKDLENIDPELLERIARGCWFPPFEPAYIELDDGRKIYLCPQQTWESD